MKVDSGHDTVESPSGLGDNPKFTKLDRLVSDDDIRQFVFEGIQEVAEGWGVLDAPFDNVMEQVRENREEIKKAVITLLGNASQNRLREDKPKHDSGVFDMLSLLIRERYSKNDISKAVLGFAHITSTEAKKVLEKPIDGLNKWLGGLANIGDTEKMWLIENYGTSGIRMFLPKGEQLFGIEPITYQDLYERGTYRFTREAEATPFSKKFVETATEFSESEEPFKGKLVLTLGGGLGGDEAYFLEQGARVHSIDKSKSARNAQKAKFGETKKGFRALLKSNKPGIHIENKNTDILTALADLAERIEAGDIEPYDYIYAHSVFHLFSYEDFKTLIELCKRVLKPDGQLGFTMRTPSPNGKGTHYETGVPLRVRSESLVQATGDVIGAFNYDTDTTSYSIDAVLHNLDGIDRRFTDGAGIQQLLRANGFDVLVNDQLPVSSYSVKGTEQRQLRFISQKLDVRH